MSTNSGALLFFLSVTHEWLSVIPAPLHANKKAEDWYKKSTFLLLFICRHSNTISFGMGCSCDDAQQFHGFFFPPSGTFSHAEIRWSASSTTERTCGSSHPTSSLWRNTFTSRARETLTLPRDHGKRKWPGKVRVAHSPVIIWCVHRVWNNSSFAQLKPLLGWTHHFRSFFLPLLQNRSCCPLVAI